MERIGTHGDGSAFAMPPHGRAVFAPPDRLTGGVAVLAALAVAAFVVAGTYVPHAARGIGSVLVPVALAVVPALVAALLVARPWSGLVAWILLMPVMNVARAHVDVGSLQLITTTALLAALAAGAALEWRRRRARLDTPSLAGLTAVALIVALAVLAALMSPTRGPSAVIALHGVIEPAMLAGLVLVLRPSAGRLGALFVAMGASVVLATAINLPRFVALYGLAFQAERIYLARLTYYNVGIFGDMLVMALPLVLLALFRPGWPRDAGRAWSGAVAALVVASLALIALAIYLTYSKSAWIGALVVAIVLGFSLVRHWRIRVAALVAVVLVSAILVPYPVLAGRALGLTPAQSASPGATPPATDRVDSFDPATVEGEMSITERYLATRAAARMALDHPLTGVGPGRFAAEYGTDYKDPEATLVLDSAHDLVPEIAAEFGLPLAALFVILVALAFLAAVATARRGSAFVRFLAIASGTSLLGFVVVATLFGVDLYRPYRLMNSDVLYAALLIAGICALFVTTHTGHMASADDL